MKGNKNITNINVKLYFICTLLFICFFIYFSKMYFQTKMNLHSDIEHFVSSMKQLNYYRCDDKKLTGITNNIFNDFNLFKNNKEWDVYIPCGYNNVENELLKINIKNKKNAVGKFIFGINGCDSIVSKNKIWESLVSCYGRRNARSLMPESFVLSDPKEMHAFRSIYNPKDIYILKKNVQRKEGLKLTSTLSDILSAHKDSYRVVQKYLTNLYLINKRKINLRIYLLIVIQENKIYFYMSNIGKCIYTYKEYSNDDFDFESNITSYHLDMNVYKKNPRTLTELFDFLNRDTNNHEASTILSENIHNLMKKISECLANNIFQSDNIKNTTCFQLFGADVIFDTNLHPYLLELNKGPDMKPRDTIDREMKTKVQIDMFKKVGLLQENEEINEGSGKNSFLLLYKGNIVDNY
jgi:hypothetical protein